MKQKECPAKKLVIVVKKHEIRILTAAARKFVPNDKIDGTMHVEIGIAPKSFAIKVSSPERGIKVRQSDKSPAIYISAASIIAKLEEQGWLVPGQFHATWDEKNKMLVAKKPEAVK